MMVAQAAGIDVGETALLEVIDATTFAQAFHEALGIPVLDSREIFHILDSHTFGKGEDFMWLDRLREALAALPQLTEEEEGQ